MTKRWVALLRGINVGGNNVIPMAELRASFTGAGFDEVVTYIASGNVVFSAQERVKPERIEQLLAKRFGYDAKIVLLDAAQYAQVIEDLPRGFGVDARRYRFDVLFVRPPAKAKALFKVLETRPGVDEVWAGRHALYFRRLEAKRTQSLLPKIMQQPFYKELTVRNWNTTVAISELLGVKVKPTKA